MRYKRLNENWVLLIYYFCVEDCFGLDSIELESYKNGNLKSKSSMLLLNFIYSFPFTLIYVEFDSKIAFLCSNRINFKQISENNHGMKMYLIANMQRLVIWIASSSAIKDFNGSTVEAKTLSVRAQSSANMTFLLMQCARPIIAMRLTAKFGSAVLTSIRAARKWKS